MATLACWGSLPVAKAFMASSSMRYTFGMGIPPAMESSSTTFQSWGASSWEISFAPLEARIMEAPNRQEMKKYSPATATAMITPVSQSPPQ